MCIASNIQTYILCNTSQQAEVSYLVGMTNALNIMSCPCELVGILLNLTVNGIRTRRVRKVKIHHV